MIFKRKPASRQARPAASRPAMNYYRSKAPTPLPPKRQPKPGPFLRRLFSRVTDTLIILAIIALVIYGLILKPEPRLKIDSQAYRPADQYRQLIISKLQSIKNRNKITFDQSGLVESLQSQYPEVSSADIHLPLFSQLPRISLTISPPVFRLVSDASIYIVDSDGLVVGAESSLPKMDKLPIIKDQSGFSPQVGQPAFSSTGVIFIDQLIAQLKKARITIKSITLPPQAQELDFIAADRGYTVKFYMGGDPLIEIGQYLAARRHFDKSNGQPGQYLDVRVAGKIFYR